MIRVRRAGAVGAHEGGAPAVALHERGHRRVGRRRGRVMAEALRVPELVRHDLPERHLADALRPVVDDHVGRLHRVPRVPVVELGREGILHAAESQRPRAAAEVGDVPAGVVEPDAAEQRALLAVGRRAGHAARVVVADHRIGVVRPRRHALRDGGHAAVGDPHLARRRVRGSATAPRPFRSRTSGCGSRSVGSMRKPHCGGRRDEALHGRPPGQEPAPRRSLGDVGEMAEQRVLLVGPDRLEGGERRELERRRLVHRHEEAGVLDEQPVRQHPRPPGAVDPPRQEQQVRPPGDVRGRAADREPAVPGHAAQLRDDERVREGRSPDLPQARKPRRRPREGVLARDLRPGRFRAREDDGIAHPREMAEVRRRRDGGRVGAAGEEQERGHEQADRDGSSVPHQNPHHTRSAAGSL